MGIIASLRIVSMKKLAMQQFSTNPGIASFLAMTTINTVGRQIALRLGMDVSGLVPADRNVEGVVEIALDATGNYSQALTGERLFAWHATLFPTGRSGMTKIKVLNRLLDGFEGKLTTSKWAKIAKCSQDTAYRDILGLIDRGALQKDPGGGRSTSYSLNIK